MDRFDDDTLFAELRELRPTPRPEFAAELDERAAAGFPRRSSASAAAMPFALLADRWRAADPAPPAGPGARPGDRRARVVATAVVAISQSGGEVKPGRGRLDRDGRIDRSERIGRRRDRRKGRHAGPEPASTARGQPSHPQNGGTAGGRRREKPSRARSRRRIESATSSGAAEAEEPSSDTGRKPFDQALAPLAHRDIERSAYIILGTKPGEVAGAAAKVYEAVHAANGVVLHSKVQSGSTGATGAYFELLIPSAQARRRARGLLPDRRSAGAPRRDQRHHRADRRGGRRTARLERVDRRPAEGARRRRNGSRTGIGRSAAARRAPPARRDPRLARPPAQARLDVGSDGADRHRPRRRGRRRRARATATGASATRSTTPATSSRSPPASP